MKSFFVATLITIGGVFGYQFYEDANTGQPADNSSAQEVNADKLLKPARTAVSQKEFDLAVQHYLTAIDEHPSVSDTAVTELAQLYETQLEMPRMALTLRYKNAKTDIERQPIAQKIHQLTDRLFNKNDMFGGQRYVIAAGDTLAKIANKHGSTERLLKRVNNITNSNLIHAGDAIKVVPISVNIQVDLARREMLVEDKTGILRIYKVGIGKEQSPTPTGEFVIDVMQVDPVWWKERGHKPIPSGDPRNPLGSRWMGFADDWRSYGIHGTNDENSIGKMSSNGCLRMAKKDVEELFDIVRPGTQVSVDSGTNNES